MVFSSPSLFVAWIGLELNTLAFLPILLVKKIKLTRESSVKYFLTQTLASVIIIVGGLLVLALRENSGGLFILLGLSIKLGAAPFHRWVISVAETLPWISLFILLTIQKINPLLMIWGFGQMNSRVYFILSISSLVIGAIIGLTQTRIRALITFSSINHVGWLLISLSHNLLLGVFYFFTYIIILLVPVIIFYIVNISHINQLPFIFIKSNARFILFFSLLSLGGLPPFLGFFPKWAVLQICIESGFFITRVLIIILSLFTLFFYLRLIFSSFIFGGTKVVLNTPFNLPNRLLTLFSTRVGGLFIAYLI